MSEFNITIESGKSARLPTAGKYCDRDIVVTAQGGGAKPVIEPLKITENGTYTAPDGVDGYSPVTVEVSGDGTALIDALIDGSISEIKSGVKTINVNAFTQCAKLTIADFPNATSIGSYAFQYCSNLTTINFPNAIAINIYAFSSCSNLTTINFQKASTIDSYAFSSCSNLTTINFPNARTIGNSAFRSCTNLTTMNSPNATSIGSSAFQSCTNLTTINFQNETSIGSYAFRDCYSFVALVLRGKKVCTINSQSVFQSCYHFHGTVNATYNPEGLKDGYIYVPAALIDQYKAATNWSAFADQFRALEDYTVDGTITGELDESKI